MPVPVALWLGGSAMHYQLQIFQTEDHCEFRTVLLDGEPWFVLADVCRALGLAAKKKGSYWDHAARLDEDERQTIPASVVHRFTSPTDGEVKHDRQGPQTLIVINESGLYSLTLRSDKHEA